MDFNIITDDYTWHRRLIITTKKGDIKQQL